MPRVARFEVTNQSLTAASIYLNVYMANLTKGTNLLGLEAFALAQGGYFDRHDASGFGINDPRPFNRNSAPFRVHLGPLPESEVQMYNGVRVTNPARSIVDAAATGTDPTQIYKAVREALARGLVTADALRSAARYRSNQHRRDVRQLIEDALASGSRE